jgi:hypothetical protein
MASTVGRRGVEAGQYATNWDQMKNATSYATWTDKFGSIYENAVVDKNSNAKDYSAIRGTTSQLISSFLNSGDASLAKMSAGLQALKDAMGGRDILMTVKKTDNGYTIEYDMAQLGKKGKESITVGKDGSLIQAGVDTGKGLVMIDHGRVKIGGQDVTSLISDYQERFQETMAVNIGRTLAEKLGLNVSKETAKLIGNTFMKSKSWEDFKQKLNDVINTESEKKAEQKANKHEEKSEKKKTDEVHAGVDVGAKAEAKTVFSFNPAKAGPEASVGVYMDAKAGASTQSQSSESKSDTTSTSKTEEKSNSTDKKDTEGSGYREGVRKELQHFVQDMEKYSKTLSKSFEDIKQETYQKAYDETKSASFAQQIAQRFGIELTPEALQKLEDASAYATKTGDATAFIRAMGEIANDSRYWVGIDTDKLNETRENIANNINEVINNVTNETKDVPYKTAGAEEAAQQAEKQASQADSLNTKGPNVNTKDQIPEPKQPQPKQPPAKQENSSPTQPQQSPQQPLTQQPQQQPPIDPEKLNKYLDNKDHPIQGQPTVGEILNKAITNPSGPNPDQFKPLDQLVRKKSGGTGGVPSAPPSSSFNNSSSAPQKAVKNPKEGNK